MSDTPTICLARVLSSPTQPHGFWWNGSDFSGLADLIGDLRDIHGAADVAEALEAAARVMDTAMDQALGVLSAAERYSYSDAGEDEVAREVAAWRAARTSAAELITHELPDEPGGLTPCCGRTAPAIEAAGGRWASDAAGAIATCPGE